MLEIGMFSNLYCSLLTGEKAFLSLSSASARSNYRPHFLQPLLLPPNAATFLNSDPSLELTF